MNDQKEKYNSILIQAIKSNNIAKAYLDNKEYNYALALFLQIANDLNDIKEHDDNFFRTSSIIQLNIGITHEQLSEYNAALSYYDSAINNLASVLAPNDNDWRMQAKVFQNMGAASLKQKSLSEAITYYTAASNKINCIHKKEGEDLRIWAKISQNMAHIQIKQKKFKDACFSFRLATQKLMDIHKTEKNSQDLVNWSILLLDWSFTYDLAPHALHLAILRKQIEIFKEKLDTHRDTLLNAGIEHEINKNLNSVTLKIKKTPSITELLIELQKTTTSLFFNAANDPHNPTISINNMS